MNLDDFRRTLDEVAGPEAPPSTAVRTRMRHRTRQTRQRRRLGTGVSVLVVVAVVAAVLAAAHRPSRQDLVGHHGGTTTSLPTMQGVFPDSTGTVLILQDGTSGIVAVDLDHRLAARRPTPSSAQEQPIGIVGADTAFFDGTYDIYAVPFDDGRAVSLGKATEFTRAAEPNDVWLVSWPGGREGQGIPSFREVNAHGDVIRQARGIDPQPGFPAMGIPEGIAYETTNGVALWDANTRKITARLGTRSAFVDDIHNDMLAWCEDLCATEHLTQIGGRNLTVTAPKGSSFFDARSARFSPNGRYLAAIAVTPSGPGFANANWRYEIDLIDTKTGTSRVVTPNNMHWHIYLAWSPDSHRLFFTPFASANTHSTLGEYVVATDELHTTTLPFWGDLGIAVASNTAAPLLNTIKTKQGTCPPPTQMGPTLTCAFSF